MDAREGKGENMLTIEQPSDLKLTLHDGYRSVLMTGESKAKKPEHVISHVPSYVKFKNTPVKVLETGERKLLVDKPVRGNGSHELSCCAVSMRTVVVTMIMFLCVVTGLVIAVGILFVKVKYLETMACARNIKSSSLQWAHEQERNPGSENLYDTTLRILNIAETQTESDSNWRSGPGASLTKVTPLSPETSERSELEEDAQVRNRTNDVTRRILTRVRKAVGKVSRNKSSRWLNVTQRNVKSGKTTPGKGANLESSHFEVDFYRDWYDFKTHFPKNECITDDRWPSKPQVCRGRTIRYPNSDSPLAFYLPRQDGNSTVHENRKGNKPMMEIKDQENGVFSVRESGIYLIHFSIMIVDESQNHSLGISVNNQIVLACPKGGFRCPHTNAEGSSKYRICVIDGVLDMSPEDKLQIKTLEKGTVVKLVDDRKSRVKAILLHRTSPNPKS